MSTADILAISADVCSVAAFIAVFIVGRKVNRHLNGEKKERGT